DAAARTAAAFADGGRADVLLVCTSGGHLMQLLALRPAWEGFSRVWVTNDRSDAVSLLAGEHAAFLPHSSSRSVSMAFRNARAAWHVVGRVRPKVMLSTGSNVAVPFGWIARLRGVRVVYVESFTRVQSVSLSCRLIAPVCDRIFVQWPE